jgi:hypothetical protein
MKKVSSLLLFLVIGYVLSLIHRPSINQQQKHLSRLPWTTS